MRGATGQTRSIVGVMPAGDDEERNQDGRGTTKARAMPSTPRMYPVPNDGIQGWFSTNWYCAPAGSNLSASTSDMMSTTSETTSPAYFASCRAEAGSRMTTAAPASGNAHSAVSHGKLVTALTSTSR